MFEYKNPFEIIDLKDIYRCKEHGGNDFPLLNFLSSTGRYAPCFLYVNETFNHELLNFLLKNGIYITSNISGKLKKLSQNPFDFKNGTFFFKYKNIYVKIVVKSNDEDEHITYTNHKGDIISLSDSSLDERLKDDEKNKTYEMMFAYTSNENDIPLKDFEPFIEKETSSKIHLFVKNRYDEYVFEPINLDLPENINIELNYGTKFAVIEKEIVDRLNSCDNGLYMFHGLAGTGKSTFLKYLTTKVKRDFIYIPATMIESFIENPNTLSSLLQKKNSVLILEDAEKIIVKRLGDNYDSSAVTTLLNLSDGILGDVLKCPIILTYNCAKSDIDEALLRKGRLQVIYEFSNLSIDDAKKLAQHLNFSEEEIQEKITRDMSLAEIYNLNVKNELGIKEKQKKVIGFGKI